MSCAFCRSFGLTGPFISQRLTVSMDWKTLFTSSFSQKGDSFRRARKTWTQLTTKPPHIFGIDSFLTEKELSSLLSRYEKDKKWGQSYLGDNDSGQLTNEDHRSSSSLILVTSLHRLYSLYSVESV